MVWAATFVLCALFTSIKAGRRGDADSYVQEFNVQSDCLANVKNVRHLGAGGVGIFYFNELTKNALSKANYDFNCHYELEAPRDFGFHVYFDYMDLSENALNTEPCSDFVQFGRWVSNRKVPGSNPIKAYNFFPILFLQRYFIFRCAPKSKILR